MKQNKIEVYDNNGNLTEAHINDSGHDLIRTVYNYIAEIKGWDTVDYIGINGAIPSNYLSIRNERERQSTRKNIEENKIIKAFENNSIWKIVFTGRNDHSFSVAYEKGKLIFDNSFLD